MKSKTIIFLIVIAVLSFVAGIIFFVWPDLIFQISTSSRFQDNNFGENLGGIVGTLWSSTAVFLFIIALLLQKQELKSQREVLQLQIEELQLQREELKLTRKEMKAQTAQFEKQNKVLEIQKFETTFYNQLKMLNDHVNSLEGGKAWFKGIWKTLIAEIHVNNSDIKNEVILITTVNELYLDKYNQLRSELSPYFRLIDIIFKLIIDFENQHNTSIALYINVFRSQFSDYESHFLIYHCIVNISDDISKNVKKYKFVKNSNQSLFKKRNEGIGEKAKQISTLLVIFVY